ncbi:MAG TPA: GntR family transcriptional regulator [Gaiellales bacterium]|nr:GntR family transcriptional regulator [Gaiellales bacterium]
MRAAPPRRSLRHSIAEGLRARVLAGEFLPGDRLPSEPELARSLGVSRSSLRAAIALLEEDGLIRRLHGSGTYVTHRPLMRNDLGRNFGVGSLIASMGLPPGTVDEHCAAEPAPAEVAERLGVPERTPVSVLRRVRTAGTLRVVDTTDWCRADLLPPELMRRPPRGSVYAALAARGLAVHHGVATITPDVAMGELAQRLAVPRGTLLLTLFQVDSTADGVPVLVSREHHLADAFEITMYRRGPGDSGEDEG